MQLPRNKGSGIFAIGGTQYTFQTTPLEEEQLVVFSPAPQQSLTDRQLEGVVCQLRNVLAEFAAELGPLTAQSKYGGGMEAFIKSFYRAFRLMDNLDFMRRVESPEGVPCEIAVLDLAGLCHQVTSEAAPLLRQAGVKLRYDGSMPTLLIPGDPTLLFRMLLELIANAARESGGGTVTLKLRRRERQAILTLSHTGKMSQRQLSALLQQDTDSGRPLPDQGAGLGMPIVRHIVAKHRGSLLAEFGQDKPAVFISLPTDPLSEGAPVKSPRISSDGGLSPLLIGLADVLPAHLFGEAGFD
jgi:signal transduction histidine kinase